jgi:hypothetical protein
MLCAMERWRRNFEQELDATFTISDDESDEFFLAMLVDHGDDEEAAGPNRRGSLQEVDHKNTKLLAFNVTYYGLL